MPIDIDIISAGIGLLLTVMIFSYLIGDNPLFRVAVYIFVGVASGYAATVVVYYVFIPRLANLLQANDLSQLIFTAISLLLGVSLLAKFFPRTSWMGSFAMAVLVGVGAAAVIGGALLGTVVPQLQAAIGTFPDLRSVVDWGTKVRMFGEGAVMLLGTVFTLAAFHFSAGRAADGTPKRPRLLEMAAWVGRIFVAITLGVIFAGVYMAALTAMIERLSSIIDFFRQLLIGS
ncbi:MAG TPA: hypothetical protein VFQ13_11940 [Anaerolineales bacterium]|nr:hypothetical protein [Anaerolineales bacterium]